MDPVGERPSNCFVSDSAIEIARSNGVQQNKTHIWIVVRTVNRIDVNCVVNISCACDITAAHTVSKNCEVQLQRVCGASPSPFDVNCCLLSRCWLLRALNKTQANEYNRRRFHRTIPLEEMAQGRPRNS